MSTPDPTKMSRRKQLVQTYKVAKKGDRRLPLWILLSFVVGGAIGFGLFYLFPGPKLLFAIPGAILFGAMTALIVFSRRAQSSVYAQMEGERGAAAASLQQLRRGWHVEPAVAFNKQQDVVHRVVGKPGIILVGEGNPTRVRQLLINERRKYVRVASEAPLHEVVCGNGEGEVPLRKLTRHVQKMRRQVKGPELTDILNRIKAIDAHRSAMPIPKGPMPTNAKGMRKQMRGR